VISKKRLSEAVAWVECRTKIVDATSVMAGPGPYPAASPFDKRISEHLGVTAFEVSQVELPPGGETVLHDHVDD
jgi:uncharacterized cupin superfamily protein